MRHSLTIAAAALLAALAACNKPAEPASAPPAAEAPVAPASEPGAELAAEDPARGPIQAAAEARLSEVLGAPAKINVEIMRLDGDWAFTSGPAITPAGGPIDFGATKMAEPFREGMMDGSETLVLLKREGGVWKAVEIAVGPTDVAQIEWITKHGVKPALVGQEG